MKFNQISLKCINCNKTFYKHKVYNEYEQGCKARRLIIKHYLACICIFQKNHLGSSLLVQDAFASLRLESRRGLGTMPLLATTKTRKQLNAEKRAKDAQRAFEREQVERRQTLKIGGSRDPICRRVFEVLEKSRNQAIAHAMSNPSKGRDAQGLLVIKEAPKAIEVIKPSSWLPKLQSAKFHKLDVVDQKLVRTPARKVTVTKRDVDSPKKVDLSKKIVSPKVKQVFEQKFEKASECEPDWSSFPDLDWAGFPSQ